MCERNRFKVPVKLWCKLSNGAKREYNYVRRGMCFQREMVHAKSDVIPKKHWNVIVHNAACLAAWGFDNIVDL